EKEKQLEKKEKEIEKMKEDLKKKEILERIVSNSVELIEELPHNSPLRRPLLHALTEGIDQSNIMQVYKLSKPSAIRIKQDNTNTLVKIKYKLNCQRSRVAEEEITALREIMNGFLPTQSGRSWVLQHSTDLHLHQQYEVQLKSRNPEAEPLSHSYV